MSWNGSHASITKAQARSVLGPGACVNCIYRIRVFLWNEKVYFGPVKPCPDCGLPVDLKANREYALNHTALKPPP